MYREEGESGHYISIGLLRPGRWRQCPGGVAMSCHHHKQINNNKHTSNTFWVRNSNWLVLSAEYLCFLILCVQRNDSWSWLLSLLLRRRIVPLIFWLILQYKMELTLRLVRSVTSWQLKTIHGKLTNFELIIHVSSDWWCRPRPWTDEKMTQCRDFLWLHLLCWYYEYLLSYIRAPDLVSRCVSFQKTTLMRNCSKHGNKHTGPVVLLRLTKCGVEWEKMTSYFIIYFVYSFIQHSIPNIMIKITGCLYSQILDILGS